jgi:polyferredoxin
MRATALGFNNAAITVFTTTIPPLVSYFIMRAEGARSHLVPSDFYTGFAFMPIMFLLALVLAALFVKETYCRPQKQAVPLAL